MRNPFQYGGVVGGPAFCNRAQEMADLLRAAENAEKLFIYSERRMGKTSLVLHALGTLPKHAYTTAYVDLWPSDGAFSFVAVTAKAIAESMGGTAEQVLKAAKEFFGQLTPSVTLDEEGKPKVTFGVSRTSSASPELEQVLAAPAEIAARGKKKVVIVFDEIQRILEYEGDKVERQLRSIVQRHQAVSYLFLGSRKHLIQKMFLDRSRPLYRSAGHYPLGPIDARHWLPFIRKKFREWGKDIPDDVTANVFELTGGHPFYTQHLCHTLWELCDTGKAATQAMMREAVQVLLDRETYAYTALWESLTLSQRRLLTGLSSEEGRAIQVFSSGFLRRYGLGSASSAQRAAGALIVRDVIDRDNGSFVVADRFFRIWIQQMHTQ